MNMVILIFIGGAFGAICRELLMLGVPSLHDGFPLDILAANMIASFLLGITAALLQRNRINQYVNALVATGIMGGLSTFSSFVYGTFEIMSSPALLGTGITYLLVSMIGGFAAVMAGLYLGNCVKPGEKNTAE
ncbi:CrcB family protein [Morganella morganii]|uniref:Fluoride-specific ion channel FluC n=1 Tax=Morganella morganii TaxID=582 RepID=A0AAI9MR39_MORMO|nr:CrcB family protein [Morganella morganii]HAS8353461.1 fluoride ion transporter CrcB [Vibrio vulnificus]HCE8947809.1 CrcB family protein [Morganella morganii]